MILDFERPIKELEARIGELHRLAGQRPGARRRRRPRRGLPGSENSHSAAMSRLRQPTPANDDEGGRGLRKPA